MVIKKRVEVVFDLAMTTISSLAESFTSAAPQSIEDSALDQKQEGGMDEEATVAKVVANAESREDQRESVESIDLV